MSEEESTPAERTKALAERSVQFEEKRQKELTKARKVHARRGSKPDAQQKVSCDLPAHR